MSHREQSKRGFVADNSKSFCIDAILKRGDVERESPDSPGDDEVMSPRDERTPSPVSSSISPGEINAVISASSAETFVPRPGFLTPPYAQQMHPHPSSSSPGFPVLTAATGHPLLAYGSAAAAHSATLAAHAAAAAAAGFPASVLSAAAAAGSAFHPASVGTGILTPTSCTPATALRSPHATHGQLPLEWFARAGMFYPRFPDFQGEYNFTFTILHTLYTFVTPHVTLFFSNHSSLCPILKNECQSRPHRITYI